ncbi:MAG: polysaccharide biosynthesis tyrosine autokinase [Actinomycetales bacterium]|nr:MAG: polysaccharide biosynthesis tyrosine autokinase [Actinomycetales bacterium]
MLLGALGLGAAALVLSGQTTRYDGSAEVLIQPTSPATSLSGRAVESYAHVLGGTALEQRAVKALGLEDAGDAEVRGEVVGNSSVVRVVVRTTDPERAAQLAGQVAEELVSWIASYQDRAAERAGEDAPDLPTLSPIVIQEGTASSQPVEPDARRTYVLFGLAGLLLGLLLAALRNLATATVTSSDALTEQVKAPVIGAVAQDRHVADHPLISTLSNQHPRAEAMRIIRTNLQFLDVDRVSNVYVVTSSVAGEGKTTTASNLAISLAQSGQNVVLVDGDLRRPRLHEVFGAEQNVGLTSVLVGKVPLDSAVQGTDVPGLDVLTSGTRPPNPSEIIQTAAMETVLIELGRRYDIVLVDAPPLLPVADAALLSVISDGAILVVRHGRTGHDQVRAASERITTVGGRLLGTIISMSPKKETARYGYGYGYDDGKGRRRR